MRRPPIRNVVVNLLLIVLSIQIAKKKQITLKPFEIYVLKSSNNLPRGTCAVPTARIKLFRTIERPFIVVAIEGGELFILACSHSVAIRASRECSQAEQPVFIIFSCNCEVVVMCKECGTIKPFHMYKELVRIALG